MTNYLSDRTSSTKKLGDYMVPTTNMAFSHLYRQKPALLILANAILPITITSKAVNPESIKPSPYMVHLASTTAGKPLFSVENIGGLLDDLQGRHNFSCLTNNHPVINIQIQCSSIPHFFLPFEDYHVVPELRKMVQPVSSENKKLPPVCFISICWFQEMPMVFHNSWQVWAGPEFSNTCRSSGTRPNSASNILQPDNEVSTLEEVIPTNSGIQSWTGATCMHLCNRTRPTLKPPNHCIIALNNFPLIDASQCSNNVEQMVCILSHVGDYKNNNPLQDWLSKSDHSDLEGFVDCLHLNNLQWKENEYYCKELEEMEGIKQFVKGVQLGIDQALRKLADKDKAEFTCIFQDL
ncbi:hypothetical protein PSHT_08721 [Puccinia striiformis]|uniref:Uncharacterized protein n=2 Tax=Puccinia striiformis TaxID=27350 RepID=A0A2S4VLQ6_9BASI|nr:hypothetical protein PSTT_08561 [Puccinia striiformis]POW10482.1 hypothetical protein PSHT_08721 [Puccinia striiformis]